MKSVIIFLLCVAIGGTGWIFAPHIKLYHLDETILAQRFFIAGLVLTLVEIFKKTIDKKHYNLTSVFFAALNGLFLFCVNYLLAFKAINYLPSGLVAMSLALICIPNIIFGHLPIGSQN